jgi:SH3 domain protein
MRRSQLALVLAVLATLALLPSGSAQGADQEAWIRGDVKLNVRTGPSTGHRIVAGVETGDNVLILARADSWTQVRTGNGKEGWIPAGYLDSAPPPHVQLTQLEGELASTLEQLTLVTSEAERPWRDATRISSPRSAASPRRTSISRQGRAGPT